MHLVIHDASLRKVAFVDNTKQNTLKYIKYEWYRSLETAGSTFSVTIQKKAIQTDNHYEVAYNHLNERSFITFKKKNKTHLLSVMVVTEDEETITCECESANLELINEYANPYKATKAMTFVEYCNTMDLLNFTYLSVGINEISDQKRTLEWEGQDTKLARLLSLANKFDAEIEFDTRLNADSSIKQFILNVYHKNDDTHQGVGRIREDVQLVYGKNVKSITRTIDKTNVVNAIRPTGTKDESTVVISGLGAWEEKNKDGVVEFYQKGEMLYAPISMQLYPSAFTNSTTNDQWTRKDITVDSDNPTVIRAEGIKALKRLAYPSITYEVDGFFDADVGDTVKVIDNGFVPKLILKARVIEQYIYDDETKNKTVLGNFTALENRISDDMQARLNELVEQAKPYTIKLSTNNGVVFKNQEGETIVTPKLYKGSQPSVASVVWSWTLDGVVAVGMQYLVKAEDIDETAVLTVAGYVDNILVASTELTLTNVNDGQTSYHHWAYSDDADGTGLTLTDNGQRYMGYYTDYTQADSTDKTKYTWADRWAKIEVGGRNLFLNSKFKFELTKNYSTYYMDASLVQTQGQLVPSIDKNITFKGANTLKIVSTFNGTRNNQKITFRTGGDDRTGTVDEMKNQSVMMSFWAKSTVSNTIMSCRTGYRSPTKELEIGTDWTYYSFQLIAPEASNAINEAILHIWTVATVWIAFPKVERGTVSTDHTEAPEDIQADIASKADQVLTQEQLNAINERNQILESEMQAKASMEAFSELEKAYYAFVSKNEKDSAQSEQDLIEASRRIELLTTQFGGLKELKTFIDTYMSSSNEGLIIGKNDASSTIKVSSDRISMFSAGEEVMYISQGVIHIDNGIFTKSLQIGRFRTEQYELNADMNVIRYVG